MNFGTPVALYLDKLEGGSPISGKRGIAFG